MVDPGPFKYILIPFDGSPSSSKALDIGLAMAKAFGARVALLSVEEHIPRFAGDIGEVREEKERQNEVFAGIQREAREAAKLQGLDFDRADILMGHVAQSIINHAGAIQCDLIVMGHSGRSGVWASFLGTTVERVSRYAHCTVVIVRYTGPDTGRHPRCSHVVRDATLNTNLNNKSSFPPIPKQTPQGRS